MTDKPFPEHPLPLWGEWTDDCQGKKDYDPSIVSISTRYWPRGGGFLLFNSHTGEFQENDARPDIRPSATSSLVIDYRQGEGEDAYVDHLDLAVAEFEADTEEEVKAQVEAWAQLQMDRAVAVLWKEFGE